MTRIRRAGNLMCMSKMRIGYTIVVRNSERNRAQPDYSGLGRRILLN